MEDGAREQRKIAKSELLEGHMRLITVILTPVDLASSPSLSPVALMCVTQSV
jgi:hypothetical protein